MFSVDSVSLVGAANHPTSVLPPVVRVIFAPIYPVRGMDGLVINAVPFTVLRLQVNPVVAARIRLWSIEPS